MGLILALLLVAPAVSATSEDENDELLKESEVVQEIELWAYGSTLKIRQVQEAIMLGVDWSTLAGIIFGDPYLPALFYPPFDFAIDEPPVQVEEAPPPFDEILDSYSLAFDKDAARAVLNKTEFGESGFDLTLVYQYGPDIALLADEIAYSLKLLNIAATVFVVQSEDELLEAELFLANDAPPDFNALVLTLVKEP